MQPASIFGLASRMSSRREVLATLGGTAVGLAAFGNAAMASALADGGASPLTAETFQPFVGQYLKVYDAHGPIRTLRLVKVLTQPRGRRPAALRDPFSLILASMDGLAVTSAMHQVQLPNLRWVEMYLNPISQDSNRYEAAFN